MHKVGENQKYTEWPQTEPEHLTEISTLYTLKILPQRSKIWSISLYG